MVSPAALGLLTSLYTTIETRAQALGVFQASTAAGAIEGEAFGPAERLARGETNDLDSPRRAPYTGARDALGGANGGEAVTTLERTQVSAGLPMAAPESVGMSAARLGRMWNLYRPLQQVDLDYAGVIATDALPRLPGHGPYLTALSTQIADPARITSDFEFADAPTDESYQRVIYRHEYADVTPWLLGGGALVVLLIGAGIVALRLLRRARY